MLYARPITLGWMTLSERVKEAVEAAKANGHSVAQIATACGISASAVYQWLSGDTKSLDGDNLAELAELSGYRPLWIAKEKGVKADPKAIRDVVASMRRMTAANQAVAVKIVAPLAEPEPTATTPAAVTDHPAVKDTTKKLTTRKRKGIVSDDTMKELEGGVWTNPKSALGAKLRRDALLRRVKAGPPPGGDLISGPDGKPRK